MNSPHHDLEIYTTYSGSEDNTVLSSIDHTVTYYGKEKLKYMLSIPLTSIKLLKKRQKIVSILLSDPDLFDFIDRSLHELKEQRQNIVLEPKKKSQLAKMLNKQPEVKEELMNKTTDIEHTIIDMWNVRRNGISDEAKELMSMIYYDKDGIFSRLNESPFVLQSCSLFNILISPALTLLLPLFSLLIPYLILRFYTKLPISVGQYFQFMKLMSGGSSKIFSIGIWVFTFIQSLYMSYDNASRKYKVSEIIVNKINHIQQYIQCAKKIKCSLEDYSGLFEYPEFKQTLIGNLQSSNIQDRSKIPIYKKMIENKGKTMTDYWYISQNCEVLSDIIHFIAQIDAYMSIAKLYKQSKAYSFVEYRKSDKPYLNIEKVWHPCIKKAVYNDIKLGYKNNNNMLITGPNAGGKSTFIKSIAIAILLAQTIGIAPAKNRMVMTPFHIFNTYLNVPDNKGTESLFEAEMRRCREHLNQIKTGKLAFVIMDEIFTGTNPREGISGGYAICKKLSKYENSIALITTHYNYLTNIDENFDNYHMPIERTPDNKIKYNYILKPGISTQFIALELLKNKGFDKDIIRWSKEAYQDIKYLV